jgi:hypothetical protein
VILDRRAFLKVFGTNLTAAMLPLEWLRAFEGLDQQVEWPVLDLAVLPQDLQELIGRMPTAAFDADGMLAAWDAGKRTWTPFWVAQTQWNQERRNRSDRLRANRRWGIVLHWFGDRDELDLSLPGYLRGFNSLREIDGYTTRTSAHFLVGDGEEISPVEKIGIIQTQTPDEDGTPFLASHLRVLDRVGHREREQYFVRALYTLGYEEPGIWSLLQEWFDGPFIDVNQSTFALELTGNDFDQPGAELPAQQIANTLAVLRAIMVRYGVQALDILGHSEITLGKPDPGKKFMAQIRYLLGLTALASEDNTWKQLVFGSFLRADGDGWGAARRYFKFVRDFLSAVSRPVQVFEWEGTTHYWNVMEALEGTARRASPDQVVLPLAVDVLRTGDHFLAPLNHEGTDFLAGSSSSRVALVTPGVCLQVQNFAAAHWGKTAVFRHRQPDGAEFVSIYSRLDELGDLRVGETYPLGYRVGHLHSPNSLEHPYLHFSLAYGAAWEKDLSQHPVPPLNAGRAWISERFFNPVVYLRKRMQKALPVDRIPL